MKPPFLFVQLARRGSGMKKMVLILSLLVSSAAFAGGMKEIYTDTTDALAAYFAARQLEIVSIENYSLLAIGGTNSDIGVRTDVRAHAPGAATNELFHCLTYFAPTAQPTASGADYAVVDTACNSIK